MTGQYSKDLKTKSVCGGDARRRFRRPLRHFCRVLFRRSVLIVGAASLVTSLLINSRIDYPLPRVHDEFSYLLAADTFAHGRLTNPPHPMWEHFETFHVLQQPTYASKYPVGQGLILALGGVLLGHPFYGVCFSVALMSAGVCWMLRGIMPARWGLFGGFMVIVLYGCSSYWARSYWGGAMAGLGGALAYGGFFRLMRRVRIFPAVIGGIGLAILANTRPYEGLLAVAPLVCVGLWKMLRQDRAGRLCWLRRAVLPVALIMTVTVAGMAYYNYRVTGNPLCMPYALYTAQYDPCAIFLFQPPHPPPPYRHEIMRSFGELYSQADRINRTYAGFVDKTWNGLRDYRRFYAPTYLLLGPMLALPWILRRRWAWFAVVTTLVVLAGSVLCNAMWPHYVAPATGLVVLLYAMGARCWGLIRVGRLPLGKWLVLLFCAGMILYQATHSARVFGRGQLAWGLKRANVQAELENQCALGLDPEGRNKALVIVRYDDAHSPHNEWVYNRADIDQSPVVWAHDMGPLKNQELLDYFHDRKCWLLWVTTKEDRSTTTIEPYVRGS